jgi:hypothetical protein
MWPRRVASNIGMPFSNYAKAKAFKKAFSTTSSIMCRGTNSKVIVQSLSLDTSDRSVLIFSES